MLTLLPCQLFAAVATWSATIAKALQPLLLPGQSLPAPPSSQPFVLLKGPLRHVPQLTGRAADSFRLATKGKQSGGLGILWASRVCRWCVHFLEAF